MAAPMPGDAVVWLGQPVVLKPGESRCGFMNVNSRTTGKGTTYHAKFVPEGQKAQRHLPGSSHEEAWKSAAALAYYEAGHGVPLPEKKRHAPRTASEVARKVKLEKIIAKGEKLHKKYVEMQGDDRPPPKTPLRQRVNESPITIKGYTVAQGLPVPLDSPFAGLPMALAMPLPPNWAALD
eukprot:CAMPEP_0119312970 /NCGR_PEP_ID=MMETSP1333-20130426/27430_1 /TAXON_ID=418940 /ORGANISM="Scyphosphaera apsteinii, Strain RCC1455" /LENGTH=179 /DNA_ID=CAMNT_0007317679 /DNA_START=17 /DNA_END=556 /DNA_ORIENTATION=+